MVSRPDSISVCSYLPASWMTSLPDDLGFSATSYVAEDIQKRYHAIRHLNWRRDRNDNPIEKNIRTGTQRDAAVVQTRGHERIDEFACLDCREGNDPFEECVVCILPDGRTIGKGACANCYWGGKPDRCSFRRRYLFPP